MIRIADTFNPYIRSLPPRLAAAIIAGVGLAQAYATGYLLRAIVGNRSPLQPSLKIATTSDEILHITQATAQRELNEILIAIIFGLLLTVISYEQPWICLLALLGQFLLGFFSQHLPAIAVTANIVLPSFPVSILRAYLFILIVSSLLLPSTFYVLIPRAVARARWRASIKPAAPVSTSALAPISFPRRLANIPVTFIILLGCYGAAITMKVAVAEYQKKPYPGTASSAYLAIVFLSLSIISLSVCLPRPRGNLRLLITSLTLGPLLLMMPHLDTIRPIIISRPRPDMFWIAIIIYLGVAALGSNILGSSLRTPMGVSHGL